MQYYVGPNPFILLLIPAFWFAGLIAYIFLIRYVPIVSWIGFALGVAICVFPVWGYLEGFLPLDSAMELRMILLLWSPISMPLILSPLIAYIRRPPPWDKS